MLDSKLRALAGCPVIEIADGTGSMTFRAHPVITARNDPILAHEICHVLAGREDFEIFVTATEARDNDELFRHVLNILYDWYHESVYGQYSGYLSSKLDDLHKTCEMDHTGIEPLDNLYEGYLSRRHIFEVLPMPHKDVIDLIVLADSVVSKTLQSLIGSNLVIGQLLDRYGKMGAPKSDIDGVPETSNYYISAVSRYLRIIEELSNLWKRNRYAWINNYYGEINWKNLPGMFLGEKFSLPVWRLFQKIVMARKIYLVVDRSYSTINIKDTIMDTTIIIAESLKIIGTPISILDVGVTNNIVNKIDEPLDLTWFTPMNHNGTPLGEVCSLITDADRDSYLLIITDGEPDDWDILESALNAFPGSYLTFVIGDSYGEYMQLVGNAVHVEPHTVIREMIQNESLS